MNLSAPFTLPPAASFPTSTTTPERAWAEGSSSSAGLAASQRVEPFFARSTRPSVNLGTQHSAKRFGQAFGTPAVPAPITYKLPPDFAKTGVEYKTPFSQVGASVDKQLAFPTSDAAKPPQPAKPDAELPMFPFYPGLGTQTNNFGASGNPFPFSTRQSPPKSAPK